MEEKYIKVTSKLGRDRWFQFPKPLEVSERKHNLISVVFLQRFLEHLLMQLWDMWETENSISWETDLQQLLVNVSEYMKHN